MAVFAGYAGAKSCTSGPQTGARGFMSWYLAKYSDLGGQNSGIFHCRMVRGSSSTTSLHGEGRAVDLGIKFARSEFAILAEQLRKHSHELGIQCIIYDRRIFSGGSQTQGWKKYTGVNPHTDHLHVEMAWWAARTSTDDYVSLLEKTIGDKLVGEEPRVATTVRPEVVATKHPVSYEKLSVDGVAEKVTISALQILMRAIKTYSLGVDGTLSKKTVVSVQTWMRDLGYYSAQKFVVDGDFGPQTVKALQRFLADRKHLDSKKWRIDGVFGKETIKALQRYLNVQAKYLKT